jgi:proteasome lid subunit RPN8/RPN11
MVDDGRLLYVRRSRAILPSRPRELFAGAVGFGPDPDDGFMLFVSADVAASLYRGTRARAPREAIGMLMGRAFQDGQGSFTVVAGATYASWVDAGPGHVKLSVAQMRALRREAQLRHPALDFVGWTHSHERPSEYSEIDAEEQKTWDATHHVGILTFMEGPPWAVAYRGPDGRRLALTAPLHRGTRRVGDGYALGTGSPARVSGPWHLPEPRVAATPTDDGAIAGAALGGEVGESREAAEAGMTEPTPPPSSPLPRLAARRDRPARHGAGPRIGRRGVRPRRGARAHVLLLGAWVVLITLGLVNAGVLLRLQAGLAPAADPDAHHQTSALVASAAPGPAWGCDRTEGSAPLVVTCAGLNDPTVATWVWDFGDGTAATGNPMTHTFARPGAYVVTLDLLTSTAGARSAGRLVVAVHD